MFLPVPTTLRDGAAAGILRQAGTAAHMRSMTTSRQPAGIPIGGQFAATAHAEPGITLSPGASTAEVIETLQRYDADTRARQRELRDAAYQIDTERGKVGAALAAIELRQAYPAAAVIRFIRIGHRTGGVAVDPDIRDGYDRKLYHDPYGSIMSLPEDQRRPLEKAMSHLSDISDDDLESQGIRRVKRPQGYIHELNLDAALALATPRQPDKGSNLLDLTGLPTGSERTLTPAEHGLPGVETLTLKNLRPGALDHNVFSMTFTLPAEANIRDLYDFDGRNREDARWAAHHAASEHLRYRDLPETELNGLPGDFLELDAEGNITVTQHDYFKPNDAIDPDDLKSWAEDLRQLTDKGFRNRLERAITERYNED